MRAGLLLASVLALVLGVFAAVHLGHMDHPRKLPAAPVVAHEVPPQTPGTAPRSPPRQATASSPAASPPSPQILGKAVVKAPTAPMAPSPPASGRTMPGTITPGIHPRGAQPLDVARPRETPSAALQPPSTTPIPVRGLKKQQASRKQKASPKMGTAPAQPLPPPQPASSTPANFAAPARVAFGRAYWVQFGAYRQKANAHRDAATLRKKGIRVTVEAVNTPFGIAFYRVRAVGFPSRKVALAAAQHGEKLLRTRKVWLGHLGRRHPAKTEP